MVVVQDEIYEYVSDVLMDALGVDAKLVKDLEAESTDFLAIVFGLEQKFKFKILIEELFPIRKNWNNYIDDSGIINSEGVGLLR